MSFLIMSYEVKFGTFSFRRILGTKNVLYTRVSVKISLLMLEHSKEIKP